MLPEHHHSTRKDDETLQRYVDRVELLPTHIPGFLLHTCKSPEVEIKMHQAFPAILHTQGPAFLLRLLCICAFYECVLHTGSSLRKTGSHRACPLNNVSTFLKEV